MAAGDLALYSQTLPRAREALGDMWSEWVATDARIANLETVCTSRTEPAGTGGGTLRAAPEVGVKFLSEARLTAVTVANNHSLDFGSDGFAETVGRVKAAGIGVSGASSSLGRPGEPALFDVKGIRVGMLGYCDTYRFPVDEPLSVMPCTGSADEMIRAVADLAGRVDITIVQLHWGYEFAFHPLRRHRDTARALARAGAHLVLCHHAHVPMGLEKYGNSVIAHGLGNCIFEPDDYMTAGNEWSRRSYFLKLLFSAEGIHSASIVPFGISEGGPRLRALDSRTDRFFRRAISRMNQRLDDTAALERFERTRTIYEADRMVGLLAAASDIQLRERAFMLATPVNREMAATLTALESLHGRTVGDFFTQLASEAANTSVLRRLMDRQKGAVGEALAGLRNVYRWQDAFLARVP